MFIHTDRSGGKARNTLGKRLNGETGQLLGPLFLAVSILANYTFSSIFFFLQHIFYNDSLLKAVK